MKESNYDITFEIRHLFHKAWRDVFNIGKYGW
jgi:hypothetical protein